MRNFGMGARVEAADFVNVIPYDLHGVWDGKSPISKHMLAHTNLAEISLASDLFWCNGVIPDKVNLGLGAFTDARSGLRIRHARNPGACSRASAPTTRAR